MAINLKDRVPDFLLAKYQLMGTVLFALLFSLVFLVLSAPFSHNAWFQLGRDKAFIYTVIFFSIATAIVILSKVFLHKMRLDAGFTLGHYIMWNVAEILIICLLYTYFTTTWAQKGIIEIHDQGAVRIFLSTLAYSFSSLGVPYIIAGLYFGINDRDNTIRLMNTGGAIGDLNESDNRITLSDNNGTIKFAIRVDNLLCIEADDNYVQIKYTDDGVLKQYMLRCRLKTIEDNFSEYGLIRCHRRFIVNLGKVSLLKAEKEGYVVNLGTRDIPDIPVSKTYERSFLEKYNSRFNGK